MNDPKPANPHPNLQALLLAALALPGVADAAAREESSSFALRYSRYGEDALAVERSSTAKETERYDINIGQARYTQPLGDHYSLDTTVAYEAMTGASPWFVQADANGQPVQVMSGPTIEDQRTDFTARLSRYSADDVLAVTAGVSREQDYLSVNGGLEWLHELSDKHSTLNIGAGYSSDRLAPSDAGPGERFPNRPAEGRKRSVTATAGFTTIINRRSQVQSALSYSQLDGFLSDPYKLAMVGTDLKQDQRPDSRWQAAWTLRYRYRFIQQRASLHADYRYFRDEWEVDAHSLGLAWYQDIAERWVLSPSLRYYSQSQAYFYQPFYDTERADGLKSSDYRLSPYGALTYGLGARYKLGEVELSFNAEHYQSSGTLALGEVMIENPGLVDFTIGSLGLEYRF